MWQFLQLLFLKLKFPPPHLPKMDEFNFKPVQYCINKIFIDIQFQSGCNIVVIEPCVMQFWLEIIRVISNHADDFSLNCNPLTSITIIYVAQVKYILNFPYNFRKLYLIDS